MANRSRTLRTLPWSVAAAFVSAVAGAQAPASHPLPREFLSLPAGVDVLAGLDLRAVFASAEFKALAIPSLLRARVTANEAAAVGDIRTVISAQAAYGAAAQGYGDLRCLARPATCIAGYKGSPLLSEDLAAGGETSGYERALHPGPAARKPGTYRSFAYTAIPTQVGRTGVRSFCGDARGRICFDPRAAPIVPAGGACPSTCTDLR